MAGTGAQAYAALLMQVQFNLSHSTILSHSFFHHPLKRRIMMLSKSAPSNPKKMLAAAMLLTAAFTGSVLFAQSNGSGKTARAVAAVTTSPLDPEVLLRNYSGPQPGTLASLTGGQPVFTKVEQMPKFDGEIWSWLRAHGRAAESRIEGKVVVQFIVDQNGTVVQPVITELSNDPRLNAEALRLVNAMPKWKPGMQQGSPVAVRCILPIYFGGSATGC
jgi:TonB family protein